MSLCGLQILVIEDDEHVCRLLEATFSGTEAHLDFCHGGQDGAALARLGSYDLIILDLMIPRKDGWEVCKELRERAEVTTPVIMLTAKTDELDKVLGLELGADDYITKPFSPRELLARCKAVVRRFTNSVSEANTDMQFGPLTISEKAHQVTIVGESVDLTRKEFELLFYLASNCNQTFSRDRILEVVWGYESGSTTRTIDEHIKRLRQKLKAAGLQTDMIQTIWGVGYMFRVDGSA